jgi:hypothetical protein
MVSMITESFMSTDPVGRVFHDLRAKTFTPCALNFRATVSFEVSRKQSNRSVIFTSENPTALSQQTSSASGRAPAIQAVHKSMSRRASSETGLFSAMFASNSYRAARVGPARAVRLRTGTWDIGPPHDTVLPRTRTNDSGCRCDTQYH